MAREFLIGIIGGTLILLSLQPHAPVSTAAILAAPALENLFRRFRPLHTRVDCEALRLKWGYLGHRAIPLQQICGTEVVEYRPRWKWWCGRVPGIWPKDGTWAMTGTAAVRIWLSTGEVIHVGTQQPELLATALTPP